MIIKPVTPKDSAVKRLLTLSDQLMAQLYPAESNHMTSDEALLAETVYFIGVYENEALAGIGAVKLMQDDGVYGEIKRVFVDSAFRGRGVSRLIMHRLETHLREKGVGLARLETGIHQPAAIGLYRKLGYVECEPFGEYTVDPLSLFMEKVIE